MDDSPFNGHDKVKHELTQSTLGELGGSSAHRLSLSQSDGQFMLGVGKCGRPRRALALGLGEVPRL
jgi:hypothetical protein